jgi:hypothetical protein
MTLLLAHYLPPLSTKGAIKFEVMPLEFAIFVNPDNGNKHHSIHLILMLGNIHIYIYIFKGVSKF